MKIAIIGGGLAGLATAFRLSEYHRVDVFDHGGGASKIATGLLHPYAGEKGRRSWQADEAMEEAVALLEAVGPDVCDRSGIVKIGACIGAGDDVEKLEEGKFLIRSGITVFMDRYLEGLSQVCQERGVSFHQREVGALLELSDYDTVVIAAGAGIQKFPECSGLKVNFVKGQALTCRLEEPLVRSVAAKQYIAKTADPTVCHFGATYERGFTSEDACLEEAVRLLKPPYPVTGCRAGVRVTNPAHYFPIVKQIDPRTWVITALGSRGLLYHGLVAKMVLI